MEAVAAAVETAIRTEAKAVAVAVAATEAAAATVAYTAEAGAEDSLEPEEVVGLEPADVAVAAFSQVEHRQVTQARRGVLPQVGQGHPTGYRHATRAATALS